MALPLPRFLSTRLADLTSGWRRSTATPTDDDKRAVKATKQYWDESVSLTLADLLMDKESRHSGKVQVLSLADFRAAVGPLWDQYADRILLIAETTIARMIGKGNTFIPQSDDTWMLLIRTMPLPDANELADDIAGRIGEKLVGAQFSPHDLPLPHAATIDLTGIMKADGSIDQTALKSAVLRARKAAPPSLPPAGTKPVAKPEKPIRPAMTPILRAAWSADTSTIDTFYLRALSSSGEDLVTDPEQTYTPAVAGELCTVAARLLSEIGTRKLRAKLVLPIPYPMLLTPAADGILRKTLTGLPQQHRLMHLRIEITRIEFRAPTEHLFAAREMFRPLVREVAFMVDGFTPYDQVFAMDHVAFGTDLSMVRGWDDKELQAALKNLRQKAGNRRVSILGLRSRTQVAMAMAAGFDEVGGPGLLADLQQLPQQLKVVHKADMGLPG